MKMQKGDNIRLQCVLPFYKLFKQKDSVINTSATIEVTKSSIKPQSSTTTNHHLRGSGERNGEQRRTKVSFGRSMTRALELVKRHTWDEALLNSEEIKPIALVIIKLCLTEGIVGQIVSQAVEKSFI